MCVWGGGGVGVWWGLGCRGVWGWWGWWVCVCVCVCVCGGGCSGCGLVHPCGPVASGSGGSQRSQRLALPTHGPWRGGVGVSVFCSNTAHCLVCIDTLHCQTTARGSLSTAHRSLVTDHFSLPAAHCSLPTEHCLLQLLTVYYNCILPIEHCLLQLLTAHFHCPP